VTEWGFRLWEDETARRWYAYLESRAVHIVKSRWKAVEAVAEALLEEKELRGKDAMELIGRALVARAQKDGD
jgi:hypothetical protein